MYVEVGRFEVLVAVTVKVLFSAMSSGIIWSQLGPSRIFSSHLLRINVLVHIPQSCSFERLSSGVNMKVIQSILLSPKKSDRKLLLIYYF